MIRTCSVNESLILNHARSISKSLFEAQMAPALQQFKFVAARHAQTTISSDDIQGSSQSSGSEEAKQLNSYISLSALHLHLQHMHWTSGLSRSISITIKASSSCTGSMAAPGSQAYVEWIFSVFGLLTAGHRIG